MRNNFLSLCSYHWDCSDTGFSRTKCVMDKYLRLIQIRLRSGPGHIQTKVMAHSQSYLIVQKQPTAIQVSQPIKTSVPFRFSVNIHSSWNSSSEFFMVVVAGEIIKVLVQPKSFDYVNTVSAKTIYFIKAFAYPFVRSAFNKFLQPNFVLFLFHGCCCNKDY